MTVVTGVFTATALTDTDELSVIIREFDGGQHAFGPVWWMPRGSTLPAVDDPCVVLIDTTGTGPPVVVAWTPAT